MLDKDFAGRFREELKTRHIAFDEDDGEFTISPGSLTSDEDGFVCIFEAVAAEAGFKSRSHFIRTFKKITGLTPSQYQRMAKEKFEARQA